MIRTIQRRGFLFAAEDRRSVQSNPDLSASHALLAAALAKLGRMEAARSAAKMALTLQRSFSVRKYLAAVNAVPVQSLAEAWRQAGLPP